MKKNKSFKTTLLGILGILPVIAHYIFPQVITSEVALTITGLLSSTGLIAAKDANVTGLPK